MKNGPHTGVMVYDSNNVKVRWNTVHECQAARTSGPYDVGAHEY